jgi:hypothetical protein
MLKSEVLFDEAERLPVAEKWRLVRQLLRSLENDQAPADDNLSWQEFLHSTYGLFRDTPIERWDAGDYEVREPLT